MQTLINKKMGSETDLVFADIFAHAYSVALFDQLLKLDINHHLHLKYTFDHWVSLCNKIDTDLLKELVTSGCDELALPLYERSRFNEYYLLASDLTSHIAASIAAYLTRKLDDLYI